MKASLILIDMVGTTVRAGDEVPETFRHVLREEGIDVADADLQQVRGRSKREAIAQLLQTADGPTREAARVEAVYRRFRHALRDAYRTRAAEVPGAGDALRRLIDRTNVVLATGLDRATARQLVEALGWGSLRLTGVVTGDDVERGRPAPDLIRAAMDRAGVTDPQRVAVVGDTVSDLEAAAAAGVGWSTGVLSGAHTRSQLEACPHSVILDSVVELPGWLEQVGALS